MQMYDLINKKRHGLSLSREEIYWIVENFTNGVIPDYQMSAFLMAVCFASMNEGETADLTMAMANSGDMLDLSSFGGFTVDKHSTGGVGDKTTLIIAPIVASYGVKVPKMSGRGLGHTGGTIDKLESIPGFKTALSFEEFSDVVKKCGLAVVGQTAHLAPADKKIYALRDITATVESIPLISSSIMSKKLATGADGIVLDIKVGSGAFMKNIDDARKLAESMTKTAHLAGRKCKAIITNMDKPLGRAIGNSLEVIEAIEVLKNKVRGDLYDICIELSANMLSLSGMANVEECRHLAKNAIENGTALEKLREMIKLQSGNEKVIDDYGLFKAPAHKYEVRADRSGYISSINCEECGICALMLGAGRAVKNADIDPSAGIILNKLLGDKVEAGEVIAVFYTSQNIDISEIEQKFLSSYSISDKVEKNFGIIIE
ncbi:MAG TPA: thymidine phosphorylase [Oscillospiraceae bacterium]|nr:thymidine phosphorylase [Oscillospiraceae bacterium]